MDEGSRGGFPDYVDAVLPTLSWLSCTSAGADPIGTYLGMIAGVTGCSLNAATGGVKSSSSAIMNFLRVAVVVLSFTGRFSWWDEGLGFC